MKQLFEDPLFQTGLPAPPSGVDRGRSHLGRRRASVRGAHLSQDAGAVHFGRGADGHCEGWNRSRFDQKAFDWLDETLHAIANG